MLCKHACHCDVSLQVHLDSQFVGVCSKAHTDAKIFFRCQAFLAQTQTLMMKPAPVGKS